MSRSSQRLSSYDPLKAGSIDGTDTVPHDRGIIRALRAVYNHGGSRCTGTADTTLFVGRLHEDTTEETVTTVFKKFGQVEACRVVTDPVTLMSKRYAFVSFKDEGSCTRAHRKSNGLVIDGSEVVVEFEYSRTLEGWKPRRLGGGLGGFKGSGQLRFGGRDRPFKKPIIIDPTRPRQIVSKYDEDKRNYEKHKHSDRHKSRKNSHHDNRHRKSGVKRQGSLSSDYQVPGLEKRRGRSNIVEDKCPESDRRYDGRQPRKHNSEFEEDKGYKEKRTHKHKKQSSKHKHRSKDEANSRFSEPEEGEIERKERKRPNKK